MEWGYGGMGSVRSGGMWSKVQSDQKVFLGHNEERGRRGAPEASADDDGSGMGWVKKRREERERKKREELAAAEAASKTDVGSAPTPVSAPVLAPGAAHDCIVVPANHDTSIVSPVRPETEDDDESSDEDVEEVDDGSSSTEQEDEEEDQVRDLPSSLAIVLQVTEEHAGTACQAGPRCGRGAHQPPSQLIGVNYAYFISIIWCGIAPTHPRLASFSNPMRYPLKRLGSSISSSRIPFLILFVFISTYDSRSTSPLYFVRTYVCAYYPIGPFPLQLVLLWTIIGCTPCLLTVLLCLAVFLWFSSLAGLGVFVSQLHTFLYGFHLL